MDLKQFRQCNKLTQTELGEYLGIKKSFVSLIENGRVKLSEEKFNKLLNEAFCESGTYPDEPASAPFPARFHAPCNT